jgi:hypothetical protein
VRGKGKGPLEGVDIPSKDTFLVAQMGISLEEFLGGCGLLSGGGVSGQ